MNFKEFNTILEESFKQLTREEDFLFEIDVDKDEMWNLYLDSFPEGTNEYFRERREFDCSCCRNFIKTIGNVVAVKNGVVKTIWDFKTGSSKYQPVIDSLSEYIKSKTIKDVWVNKLNKIGVNNNYERLENGEINQWFHFFVEIPRNLVNNSASSEAEIKGELRTSRNVFKRSLDEITEISVETVLELTNQNSLYKGDEWKSVLNEFLKYKKEYDKLETDSEKEIYAWENSVKVGGAVTRIRNHSMGTLLLDISEGLDLDTAVKKYEKIVAPENYKRSKPIYTKQMLEEAKKTIEKLGFMDSLPRRHAILDDITVNDILFSNKDSAKNLGGLDVFAEMEKEVAVNPKKFSKVEEISIDKFVEDVLPTAKDIEVLLENKHASNMMSLIAPENKNSESMFKWKNGFSWAYSGNMTDSSMRDRVKLAGGNVEGVLRFSIQWNDEEHDGNDLDAHCIEPSGFEIYYGDKRSYHTNGTLDVDIINPKRGVPAVENITWSGTEKMEKGIYKFLVHNFRHRGGRNGFKAEIEFEGQIYSFEYNKDIRGGERVVVAEVKFDGNGFTIKEMLSSNVSSRDIWGLKSNQFVPVSVILNSPNHWSSEKPTGNKHFFFMLKNAKNPENPNGFYNEFLKEELSIHRKVFEALSSKMAVRDSDEQLSGLGFSSTRRNELIVKITGLTQRILKIKF